MHQPDFVPVPPRRAPHHVPLRSHLLRLTGLCFLLLLVGLTAGDLGRFAVAEAADVTVFGPKTYARDTGKPKLVVDNFTIANPADAFTLVIENGADKKSRVASAVILINGVVIVGPEAFDKQVERIQRPVWLRTQNQIAVEVRGPPKTFLKISILSGRSNQRPVADAGMDRTVLVGQPVELDGSGSTDGDGDALTFHWSLTKPAGSGATLSSVTAINPTFTVDSPGRYEATLVVNDGREDSLPDTVTINTQNSPPVAVARLDLPEQKVYVGSTVVLNGEDSSDADGDPLTYLWSIEFQSRSNGALLSNPTSAKPSLRLSLAGSYSIKLVVDDGKASSEPAYLTVTTLNSAPVADAGPDQSGNAGDTITLDGAQSYDVDGDALSYLWALTAQPAGSAITLGCDPASPICTFEPQTAGDYLAQLIVQETDTPDKLASPPDTASIAITASGGGPNAPPVFTSAPVTTATAGAAYTYPVAAADPDGDGLSFSLVVAPGGMVIDPLSGLIGWTPLASQVGLQEVTVRATDARNASSDQSFSINVAAAGIAVPDVTGQTQADAGSAIAAAGLVVGSVTQASSETVPAGQVISQSPPAGASVAPGTAVNLILSSGPVVPPDVPSLSAPPVDPTVATTVADATSFLYSGPNPVQTGVAPGTIEARRAAVIRGRILDRDGQPLPGVTLTVLGHPEFGQTVSRADGRFDLAVNGGGTTTVNYTKIGVLPVQRQIDVPWQDYVNLPDVVMIPVDTNVTTIAAGAEDMQVHRGAVSTDSDGSRQAVLLFPAGTTAQMVLPDGSTLPLPSMNVRATEYTVGPQGPRAMPAALPPTSGYTYAVELSVDEALAAGATRVDFGQPVVNYVDNFVGFPVGMAVPTGYYDRAKAAWVAAPNGRVIRITGVTGGLADVDTVGTGALPALVLDTAERQQLATLYPVGQELWRVPISHFTPWDHNWPYGPPADAIGPPADPPRTTASYDGSCEAGGSIIDCEGQTLGEALGIPGTSFALRYRSDRVPARAAALEVPVTGPAVPSSLMQVRVTIEVAGTVQTQIFPPLPNQTTRVAWDGLDAYGRPVQGAQQARVQIDFVYPAVFRPPSQGGQSFALPGDGVLAGNRQFSEVVISMVHLVDLARADLRGLGLGGWALDVHHAYHPGEQSVQFGTGRVRRAKAIGRMVTRVDFGGFVPVPSSTGKAWAVGPDGSVYFVTRTAPQTPRVRRLAPDGTVTVVAGNGQPAVPPYGDGGPALAASFRGIGPIEMGPDGSLYINDIDVIRRVRPDGIIEHFAGVYGGNCSFGPVVDGVSAIASPMCPQQEMAVAPDGSVYFIDQMTFLNGGNRVRRVGPDGVVTTIAHNGAGSCNTLGFPTNPCGDGGPATQAQLFAPLALAFAADGSLYLGDSSTIRRIGTDGIITRIAAQNGNNAFGGDGGPALTARFSGIADLVVEADGTIHLLDSGNNRVRTIDPQGIVRTIAGTAQVCGAGQDCNSGDGGPVGQARVRFPQGMKLAPDGSVYFSVQEGGTTRIRRIGPALPGLADFDLLVPAPDGGEVYQFDRTGRHLRTRHPLTGAPLREFDYDAAGRLIRVREMTGAADNVTTIEHDAAGHPTAIVGPFGDRTTLTVDAHGFLASFANSAGNTHQFASTVLGLMASHTDPRGNTTTFTYDADGRLTLDAGPAGASQALARGELPSGFGVVRTTGLGLATSYAVEAPTPGVERRTVIASDTTMTVGERRADASSTTVTHPDGTIAALASGPDPRFAMQAPIAASHSVRLPSALERLTTTMREVTLADPANPLSLTSLTDRITTGGQQRSIAWNGAARTLTFTSPEGRVRTLTLDALGRVVGFAGAGIAPAVVSYDARGRVERRTIGSGAAARQTHFAFDQNGRVASVTDPLGRVVGFTYDAAGRRVASTRPDGSVVQFAFDAASNLTGFTPPGRPAHGFAYDARNALASLVPPPLAGTGATAYATDADGRLTTVTRPDGDVVTLAYDTGGRLASRTVMRSGAPVGTWTRTYDAAGRVATLGAPGPLGVAYQWDGPLPVAETWTDAVAGTVARTFDTRFRPTSESVNGAHTVAFAWNGDGLLTAAGAFAITRDASTGLPVAAALGTIADTFSRDAFGAPNAHVALAGGAPLYATSWVRDAIDRATQRRETVGADPERVFDYAYDLLGRLVSVHRDGVLAEAYAWDANGNRTSATVGGVTRTATYDVHDRLSSDGATTFSFDALGRLATKTTGASVTQYRYDPIGNLAEVQRPSGQRIGYLTDGNGRRVGRLVDDVLVQGFLYADALRPAAELDGSGTVVSRFVYAGGVTPAYMVRGADTYRIVTDGMGSVRVVVNAASGAIAQRIEYDAFGNVTGDTNPGFQPFGFAGGLYDRDTGLVRMGVRDYDPVTGRFTTRDPIGFAGGSTNLYAYAGGDPVNASDPTGLDDIDWHSFAAGLVNGAFNMAIDTVNIVFPIRGLTDPIGNGIRQLLEDLGVGSYRDMMDVAIDALDLEVLVNRDSTEFFVGEMCGAVGLGAVSGGAGLAGGAAGGARGFESGLASGASRALGSGSRAGGLTVSSVRDAEQAIARVISNEAAALDAVAAQQVARAADEGGLVLVRTSQRAGGVAPQNAMGGVSGRFW